MADGAAEAGVQRLDRVGRIHELAELGREGEERDELFPDRLPCLDHRRVELLPLAGELGEARFGGLDGRGGVDLAHRRRDLPQCFFEL